jgi:hypothetical protein
MSPVSAVVGRRLAFGGWLALALVACQGPDEYLRYPDGGISGVAGAGQGGSTGMAGTFG